MIVLGTIKHNIPLNSFTLTILCDLEGNLYKQKVEENRIQEYIPIDIDEKLIIKTDRKIKVKKGSNVIYSFLTENNHLIIGSLADIQEELIGLINEDTFDPVAKLLISTELKLHGITNTLIEKCNQVFISSQINCKIDEDNYLMARIKHQEFINIKIILSNLKHSESLLRKFDNLSWKDLIATINNKFILNDFRIKFDEFFSIINDNEKVTKRYISSIIALILERIEEEELDLCTIRNNKCFFHSLVQNDFDRETVYRIMSPSYKYWQTEKNETVSIMFRGFDVENHLMGMGDNEEEEYTIPDTKDFLEQANKIKTKLSLNSAKEE